MFINTCLLFGHVNNSDELLTILSNLPNEYFSLLLNDS